MTDICSNVISLVISVLIGGAITLLVAGRYYAKAAKDLKAEASELLRLSTMTLRALENAGLCTLYRDSKEKIVDIVIRIQPHSSSVRSTSSEHNHCEQEVSFSELSQVSRSTLT